MNFFLVNICIYSFVDFYGGIYRSAITKLSDDYVGVSDLYAYVDRDLSDFVFKSLLMPLICYLLIVMIYMRQVDIIIWDVDLSIKDDYY